MITLLLGACVSPGSTDPQVLTPISDRVPVSLGTLDQPHWIPPPSEAQTIRGGAAFQQFGRVLDVGFVRSTEVPSFIAGGTTVAIYPDDPPEQGRLVLFGGGDGEVRFEEREGIGLGAGVALLSDPTGDQLDELIVAGGYLFESPYVEAIGVEDALYTGDAVAEGFRFGLQDGASLNMPGRLLSVVENQVVSMFPSDDEPTVLLRGSGDNQLSIYTDPRVPGVFISFLSYADATGGLAYLSDLTSIPDGEALEDHISVYRAKDGVMGFLVLGVGDLDGDGRLEVVVKGGGGQSAPFVATLEIPTSPDLPLIVESTFMDRSAFGTWGNAGAVADLDGDGFDDLLLGDAPSPDHPGTVSILRGPLAPGEFTSDDVDFVFSMSSSTLGSFGQRVAAADIDGDGQIELAVAAPNNENRAGAVFIFEDPMGPWLAAQP